MVKKKEGGNRLIIVLIIIIAILAVVVLLTTRGGALSQQKITASVTGEIGLSGLFYGWVGTVSFSNPNHYDAPQCVTVVITSRGEYVTSQRFCEVAPAQGSINKDVSIGLGALDGPYSWTWDYS